MKPVPCVAFLGPEGTFAHTVARKRFGTGCELVSQPSIKEVFQYVRAGRGRLGVVPVENSSGGTIFDTVDCLLEHRGKVFVRESLSLNVKLALLGRDPESIHVIYSHFAPLQHCGAWLDEHFPGARRVETPSTAQAVQRAVEEQGAAAIGNKVAASRYHLRVLRYPIETPLPNRTQFFIVGRDLAPKAGATRMTLLVSLPNTPGSLCDFLTPFKTHGINLSRILSRAIPGQPSTYVFVVDVEGTDRQPDVRRVFAEVRRARAKVELLGVYPVRRPYTS
jgi:chorismate mutase / prephenate dehydratase